MPPLRVKGYKIIWYLWPLNREGALLCHKTIYIHEKNHPILNTLYAFNDFQIYKKELVFEKLQVRAHTLTTRSGIGTQLAAILSYADCRSISTSRTVSASQDFKLAVTHCRELS